MSEPMRKFVVVERTKIEDVNITKIAVIRTDGRYNLDTKFFTIDNTDVEQHIEIERMVRWLVSQVSDIPI